MSDLETVVVTFQTKLSDVMETVMKTAMYEVTRLVEDGLLLEMKRRNQEMESLRTKLLLAEKKLIGQGEKDHGRRSNRCAVAAVNLSRGRVEEENAILGDCGYKKETDCVESWAGSQQEVSQEISQEADNLRSSDSPDPQAAEESHGLPAVDVKEEHLSCSSVHYGDQGLNLNGEEAVESHSSSERTAATPKPANERKDCNEELKRDPQTSSVCLFPEEREDVLMDKGLSEDMDRVWACRTLTAAELQQSHKVAAEKESHQAKIQCSPQHTGEDGSTPIPSGQDHNLTSSPVAPSPSTDILGGVVKQEVFVGTDRCDESRARKIRRQCHITPLSVKHRRVSSEPFKQSLAFHKATLQEVTRLHPRQGTGARLQAAIQQLQRPTKRPVHLPSAAAALSASHSQAANLFSLSRTPSTSKASPPSLLSAQRGHPGGRGGSGPWVGVRAQRHAESSGQRQDSEPHVGPRHLLRCGQCGRFFPHPSNLKAHLLTHTGERPFCCSLCGRSFTKLSNLKAHRRVHTGERPYCCLACGKCFTQKCNLKRHQRIHLEA